MDIEIKFRAWDNEQNKMLHDGDYWLPSSTLKHHGIIANKNTCYPIKITNHGIVSSRQLGNSFIWVEVHDDRDKPHSRSYYDEWEGDTWTSGFPVMQYTGLKDKNGKEGYFCDIASNQRYSTYWVIEWDDIEARYYLKSLAGYDPLPLRLIKEMVIIGNIYENPELLS